MLAIATGLCAAEASAMDVVEERVALDAAVARVAAQIAPADADPRYAATAADAALPLARTLAEAQRARLAASSPALAGWLADRGDPTVERFATAPVVLTSGRDEAAVVACWRAQLRACAAALDGLRRGDAEVAGLWLYWGDGGGERAAAASFFRTEQLRDCLYEIRKLGEALAGPRRIERLAPGDAIVADDFSRPLAGWRCFGGATVGSGDGSLRVSGDGSSLWQDAPFADALVAFDYRPVRAEGDAAGALFAFAGSPVAGSSYESSAGPMERYNRGIDTYHVSLYRGASRMTNLRRTGRGLKMLSSVRPDACGELGRSYRVELLRRGPTVEVIVDGTLVHAYLDAGVYGPRPGAGCFGLRLFSGGAMTLELRRFSIRRLEPTG